MVLCFVHRARISADIYQCVRFLAIWYSLTCTDCYLLRKQHARYFVGLMERSVNVHRAHTHLHTIHRIISHFHLPTELIFTHVNHFNGKMHRLLSTPNIAFSCETVSPSYKRLFHLSCDGRTYTIPNYDPYTFICSSLPTLTALLTTHNRISH